jgi:uncharacterized protein
MSDDRTQNAERVANFLEEAVKLLVNKENEVHIGVVQGAHAVVFEVVVGAGDVGKVIGKRGAHADAIRRIIHAAAGKFKTRYIIEIIEQDR